MVIGIGIFTPANLVDPCEILSMHS
jgi:hypothetical protein